MGGAGFGIERFRPVRQEITVGFKMRVELDKALGRTATREPYSFKDACMRFAISMMESATSLVLHMPTEPVSPALHLLKFCAHLMRGSAKFDVNLLLIQKLRDPRERELLLEAASCVSSVAFSESHMWRSHRPMHAAWKMVNIAGWKGPQACCTR